MCVSCLAALHHCTCSLGCKHERRDECEKARQEEASYLIESNIRFQFELIDFSLVTDRAPATNDDRNGLINLNKTTLLVSFIQNLYKLGIKKREGHCFMLFITIRHVFSAVPKH